MAIVSFKTLGPLAHGAFDAAGGGGNATPLRRMPVLLDGDVVQVPCVSGNALRGRIRREVMAVVFDELRIDDANAWMTAANGGKLDGHDKTVTPERIEQVRADCPPLSVLGSGMGDWFLPGRVDVGILWPVCDVTVSAGLVEPRSGETVPALADIESEVWHSRLPDRERQNTDETGQKPMPHGYETLNAGVRLSSALEFRRATAVEASSVMAGIERIRTLGGRSAAGLGRVRLEDSVESAPFYTWLAGADAGAVREALGAAA